MSATMTRAAIYARYSSDLQSDASIEDQISLCEAHAAADKAEVVNCYTDHAISGASMMRPGVQMLMQDGAAGKFDVLYAEALDRISRDQEDIAAIYKRLSFAGVKIITQAEGEITELHIGLKGTMNALFLKDLAQKTHRGLRGRAEAGKIPAGICYGYDAVRRLDANGAPVRGERKINAGQAEIVRRIFREYADGISPRAIVARLNEEGVEGPSGKGWTASTLNGNWRRGLGVLNNELYIGQLVWNRQRFLKDPETGKRVTRLNDESEWVRAEVPHLRILNQALWDRVKARQLRIRKKTQHIGQARRPTYLLSHLLKCGCCGGGVSKRGPKHYACSAAYERGPSACGNRRTIRQDDLEETILRAIRDQLMDPRLIEVFCAEYTEHLNRLRASRNAGRAGMEAELTKLQQAEKRMIQAICDGFASDQLKADMNANTARQKVLRAELETEPEEKILLHPAMATEYRKQVENIVRGLSKDQTRAQAIEIIRSMIDRVVLRPLNTPEGFAIDLYGDLAGILRVAQGDSDTDSAATEEQAKSLRFILTDMKDAAQAEGICMGTMVAGGRNRRSHMGAPEGAISDCMGTLVAGAGFEPATFRL